MGPDSSPTKFPTLRVADALVHSVSEDEVLAHVISESLAGRGGWVVTHNLDHLRRLRGDRRFRSVCARANLRVADGMPLIWASRILGKPLPQRVAGSHLIFSLSAAAAASNRSIFLLGGNPGTAEGAGTVLANRYPGLRVAGSACPPFGFERDPNYFAGLVQRLKSVSPDIIFVGLGSPKQEYVIEELQSLLPQSWFLGVGISFSFVCGEVVRAPLWLQRIGLEWAHRLGQEPRRLAKRYLYEGLPYAAILFLGALRDRIFGREVSSVPIPSTSAFGTCMTLDVALSHEKVQERLP